MKPSLTKIITMIFCILPFWGCETLSDPNSLVSKLGTQVLAIGISQATGRNVTAADLDGAAALIRTLAGKKTPTPTEIVVAVKSGTDQPSKAQTLASKVSDYVTSAIVKGLSPDRALETAASNLNQAAEVKR